MEHPENNEEYKGLVVNKGIEQPSSVNPYLKRKPKKRQLSVAEFVEGIVKGDVTILNQVGSVTRIMKEAYKFEQEYERKPKTSLQTRQTRYGRTISSM